MKPLYLDHAASAPVDPRVLKAMLPFFSKNYANPSSLHEAGRKAREVVEDARKRVAKILHCPPQEIIFTSGGTESINLAIKGMAWQKRGGHIITSKIEHPAVLETCNYLEEHGFSVTYLPVDKYGLVSPAMLEKAIRQETILITVMYANNEIGTIQPIAEIGRIAQKHRIPFHTDACQAGMLDINVEKLNVDLLSLNASKLYGPKDCAILYKRKELALVPLLHGGGQEFGLRSGTENVPGIIGFATALELVQQGRARENARSQKLRDYFIAQVLTKIPDTNLNGHPRQRLPNNVHVSFAGVDAEQLLQYLSAEGIYVSTGSACSAQEIEVSHVLRAMGLPEELARGSIRFSLGRKTTRNDVDRVVKVLQKVVGALRKV